MNWEPVALVVFVAFFGGLLLISRVTSWIAGLVLILKSSATEATEKAGFSLAQVFLHSGPWSLALAIAAIYYAASLPQQIWLWAVLGGFGLAGVLLAIALLVAQLRQRRGATSLAPLTAERLLRIRRRFLWGVTIYFGGAMATWMLYAMWSQLAHSIGLVIFVLAACLGGGYAFSWFMWQFYGAALQARESARERAERNNAV